MNLRCSCVYLIGGAYERFNKGRAWSKIIFCVWFAFAVKIVVAMTAELNLAWFTRYETRKLDGDDITAFSLTRTRAMRYIGVIAPRKLLEQPNFCENSSLTIKFRTFVESNVSNTLIKELCDFAL